MATAHLDGTVRVWHADKMKLRQSFQLDGRFAYGTISFSPDGLWLATGAAKGNVSLWDPLTARLVADAGVHQHYVYTVGFGRDSRTLLTGGEDGACYLWDLRPRGNQQEKDLARVWVDLVGEDGPAAYRAIWTLSGMPEHAVTLLAEKTGDWERLSADRSTDEQSTAARRAVSLLIQIGTPNAILLLKKWAAQNRNGVLGQSAAEALRRLSRL
jgi:WD40 repeat protein